MNGRGTPLARDLRLFLNAEGFVDIRFISSLTDTDEDRFAHVLLKAMADLLAKMPITYLVRIETNRGKIFQRSRSAPEPPPSAMKPSSTLTR